MTQYLKGDCSLQTVVPPFRRTIVYSSLDDLKPNPRNPRKHTQKQKRQIAASIRRFGFNVPVLIDADGRIIAGHGRVEAAKLLGIVEIPTICLDDLSPAQAQAFMLADNKLAENSAWDDRLLAEHLQELAELCLDFSLEDTGFEMGEIDVRIESLGSNGQNENPGDQISDFESQIRVTRAGDLWLLEKHRVYCGDARHCESLDQVMQSVPAVMVFIDPPYNIAIEDNVSGKGSVKHTDFAMACGEMSAEQFTGFLMEALSKLKAHLRDGALVFVCMDWRHVEELLAAGKKVFSEFKHLCVWAKDRASQGSFYRSQHELIFVFKNGKAPHINNFLLGQYGRYRTNVWQYPSAVSLARSGEEGNLLALHPTVKPVQMIADAIMDCSKRGDIVLDSFLGSGTTVIAAERTGRICYGVEIEPRFVDVIVRRWQAFTGKEAIHASTGRSFAEIEGEVSCGQ